VFNTLRTDFQVIFDRDPAARNWLEVLLCYPGLHAIWIYRFAHWLHLLSLPIIPRFISQLARFLTGIEIHPGAVIGSGAFIDHGMGVVIGETVIIGENVLLYQGVTLGGTGKELGKRHPTLGDNVVVGAGAKVLGNIEIGNDVRIGAGSVLLKSVPSGSTVVGIPGRVVQRKGESSPLDHSRVPDPEGDVIRSLVQRVEQLEHQQQSASPANTMAFDYSLLATVRPKHFQAGNGLDKDHKSKDRNGKDQTGKDHKIDEQNDQLDGFSEGAGI
jgi:serine O-acetyltransferase